MVTDMDSLWVKITKSKPMILLLLTGAAYFFLKYISPLVGPVLLSVIFVTIFGPLLKRIQRAFMIHRQIGAAFLLGFAIVVLLLVGWIISTWLMGSIPHWLAEAEKMMTEFSYRLEEFSLFWGRKLGVDSIYLENTMFRFLSRLDEAVEVSLMPRLLTQSLEYAGMFGKAAVFVAAFFIGSILLAKDYDTVMNWMLEREEYYLLLEVICGVIQYVASFVRAQGIIMAVIAAVCGLGLQLSGVQNGILWGILAGGLDALPFVGTGIILVPIAVIAFVKQNTVAAVVSLLLYVIAIFIRQFLEPKLIGNRMGIPPIAVLISIYAGVAMFGISGIIKGPLGYVLVFQTYRSVCRRVTSKDC